jgi:hypothetical protein
MLFRDSNFDSEDLPPPDLIEFEGGSANVNILYASGSFIRNAGNTNLQLSIPLGTDISPGTVWFSPNIFLDTNTLNMTEGNIACTFEGDRDLRILKDIVLLHDIYIQFKLSKADGTNYFNNREIRCILVREDGTSYDSSIYANNQPNSNAHDYIQIKRHISHNLGDLVRIKFNVAQDNREADTSDTRLTIFRITWNTLGLEKD